VWRPGLTTVHQDFEALGERAFGLLAAQLAGDRRPTLSSDLPWLVRRGSAAAPGRRLSRARTAQSAR
jgi:DNA-binding LacI/PurR family transcriptional regulator